MNKKLLILLFSALFVPVLARAEGLLKYNPPKTGAPLTKIGGGTRGLSLGVKSLLLLAPQQLAFTSQAQPVLFWYSKLSKPQKVQISIVKEAVELENVEKQVDVIATPGLQTLRLTDYGVTLQPGIDYRWSVEQNDDLDSVETIGKQVSALISYRLPESPLPTVEQQTENGYWYDALQQLIESHSPQANDLLEQAGIKVPKL